MGPELIELTRRFSIGFAYTEQSPSRKRTIKGCIKRFLIF